MQTMSVNLNLNGQIAILSRHRRSFETYPSIMRWPAFLTALRAPQQRFAKGFSDRAQASPYQLAPSDVPQNVRGDARRSTREEPERSMPFPLGTGPHGHRARMREKLITRGPNALADYELLEMLLYFAQPKGDTKPLAKALINRFGSYADVLNAPPEKLLAVTGVGEYTLAALKLSHATAVRLAQAEATARPVMSNWGALIDYLTAAMAHERIEQFRVLYLDTRNRILSDEILSNGTVNHTPVYPREVLRRALDLHATALILVHNHPSGDPAPSQDDLALTTEIRSAAELLGLVVHDHIIIGKGKWRSLRKDGLL